MPNRIIRESCRTSPTLAQLSADAERLFWRLLTFADDYGRFPAEPSVVRGACFPRQESVYPTAKVKRLLGELSTAKLVSLYFSGDHCYGYFVTWHKYQQRRAKTSKYPDPLALDSICEQMPANVPVFEESRNRGIEESRHEDSDGFAVFWAAYPRKTAKARARRAWGKIADPPLDQMLVVIEVAKQSPDWQKENGKYIPHPATWLNDERWLDEIPKTAEQEWYDSIPLCCAACGEPDHAPEPCTDEALKLVAYMRDPKAHPWTPI